MEEKGILTNEQEKALAKIIDGQIKLKGLLELVDGYAAKVLISLLDDSIIDKIDSTIKLQLQGIVKAAMNKEHDQVIKIGTILINSLINIPKIDENMEALIIKGVLELIVGFIVQKSKEGIKKEG